MALLSNDDTSSKVVVVSTSYGNGNGGISLELRLDRSNLQEE